MSRQAKQLNRSIPAFCLLVLLPLFATATVLHLLIGSLITDETAHLTRQLTTSSELIGAGAHSESFFKPIFNNFIRRYFEFKEDDLDGLHRICNEYSQQAGTRIEVFAFNSEGGLIENEFSPVELHPVALHLWESINEFEVSTRYEHLKPDFQRIFGRDFHPRKMRKMRNRIFSFIAGNRPGMIYFSRKREAGAEGMRGIILLVRNLPNHTDILNKSLTRFKSASIRIAILPGDNPQNSISLESDTGDFVAVAELMRQERRTSLAFSGQIWQKTAFTDFSIIAGKKSEESFYTLLQHCSTYGSLAVALAALLLFVRSQQRPGRIWISIRLKLIVVFIFAVYLPLLGLFYLSFQGLQDRRSVLENDAQKGMLDVLYQIDSDFSTKETEIKALYDRLFHSRAWQTRLTGNWSQDHAMLKETIGWPVEGESLFNWLEIRDTNLEQLFCTAKGEANNRIKDLNRVMAQISLEKFVPELLSADARKIRQSDFIIRNIIENPVLGFSHFFEVPGQIVQMEFEGAFLYWYWNYYQDPQNGVVFLSGNTRAQLASAEYLSQALKKRFSYDNVQLQLVSYHPTEQKWLPEESGIDESIEVLTRIGTINQRITSSRIEINGRDYLATCFPGIRMRDVMLTCLFPVAEIDAKIDLMRSRIFIGMIMILLVAILTGLLLTKAFLRPVAELNQGLNALRQRETEFRVKIDNNDEFGDLGETFNQMMIEVKEMLLAGAVQQCLIPTDPPQIPGYELIVFNQMATDVGGDYADAFILPEDRFLLVLGDVTGHGISSSILTAMVKALIFRFSCNPYDLSLFMRDLSIMIFDLLDHRKLMTFCAVIIEQKTGEYQLTNAGHPFPLICDRDGNCRAIEHNSLPLGVSKKRSNYPASTGRLQPGDWLMMYTDGIAEAGNDKGEMFSFERVGDILRKNCKESGETCKNDLLQQFWSHYTDEHLEDDLTFIMLKNCASE